MRVLRSSWCPEVEIRGIRMKVQEVGLGSGAHNLIMIYSRDAAFIVSRSSSLRCVYSCALFLNGSLLPINFLTCCKHY